MKTTRKMKPQRACILNNAKATTFSTFSKYKMVSPKVADPYRRVTTTHIGSRSKSVLRVISERDYQPGRINPPKDYQKDAGFYLLLSNHPLILA